MKGTDMSNDKLQDQIVIESPKGQYSHVMIQIYGSSVGVCRGWQTEDGYMEIGRGTYRRYEGQRNARRVLRMYLGLCRLDQIIREGR